MSQRILLIGQTGQLSIALIKELQARSLSFLSLSRNDLDLAFPEKVYPCLDQVKPALIINATAYTDVNKAESDFEMACKVNAESPAEMARYSKKNGIQLIHYSTDYVFSGEGQSFYTETDNPQPLNAYGKSKWLGEKAVLDLSDLCTVFRTSWVYSHSGKNFLKTMQRLHLGSDLVRVVGDQFGAPTLTDDLASQTLKLVDKIMFQSFADPGLYHLCGGGVTTWYSFASQIFCFFDKMQHKCRIRDLREITSEEFLTPVKRPKNSRLSCAKAKTRLGLELEDWSVSLQRCLESNFK